MHGKYQLYQNIGSGTYGTVYLAKNPETGATVAIKKIRLDSDGEGVPSTALREIGCLKAVTHPNLVTLHEVMYKEGKHLSLVFEHMKYDLRKYLDSLDGHLSMDEVRVLSYQMLNGIEHCHRNRILHRDLKPQNLLIDSSGRLKVADFGLARFFQYPIRTHTHEIITLWYRPPEVLLGCKRYDTSIDVWSAGVIIAEMITKKPTFPGDSEIDELFKIFRVVGTPTSDIWPSATRFRDWQAVFPQWDPTEWYNVIPRVANELTAEDILTRMIALKPESRPSVGKLLTHPFFNTVAHSKVLKKR